MTTSVWRAPVSTSSLRAQRSKSRLFWRKDSGLLRYARNDGARGAAGALSSHFKQQTHVKQQTHRRILAARFARALLSFTPSKIEGAGKAGCRLGTRGPPCAAHAKEELHSGIQVRPNARPSLRSGLTAYAVLSREPNSFWPPSLCELTMRLTRLGSAHLRKSLTVAMTARTTRFCRTLQRWSSTRSLGFTGTTRPPRAIACPTLSRPPQPTPRS